jgi:hypothetical protein
MIDFSFEKRKNFPFNPILFYFFDDILLQVASFLSHFSTPILE